MKSAKDNIIKYNLKNINIYQEKLEEEYKKYQKDISTRLQRRYQNPTRKASNKDIQMDNRISK